MSIRLTHATAMVLKALAAGYRYGFDIMDATGLPSGTVYPVLRRLDGAELVDAAWEASVDPSEVKRPRRRLYALTAAGRALVPQAEARLGDVARFLPAAEERAAGGEA